MRTPQTGGSSDQTGGFPGTVDGPRQVVRRLEGSSGSPEYSLCVMVTDWTAYRDWRLSFEAGGFDSLNSEFLVVDNVGVNRADAFQALNEFLQVARAEHVVLVHHDVRLLEAGVSVLSERLRTLTVIDPTWAVCGNAGARSDSWPVLNLSHPWRERDVRGGPFPARVMSLDENFLVVRRLANLALSRDLSGFHHYGADLCLVADVLGWSVHVIDFYLRHDSGGTFDSRYESSRLAIARKYSRAFRSRWVELVTNQPFYVGSNAMLRRTAALRRKVLKATRVLPRTSRFERAADEADAGEGSVSRRRSSG